MMARRKCKWNKAKTICTRSDGVKCKIVSVNLRGSSVGYRVEISGGGKGKVIRATKTKDRARKICRGRL